MIDTSHSKETAILVGVATKLQDMERTMEYLEELAFLVDTAGGVVLKKFFQKLEYPDPRTYIGSGKLNEVREYIESHKADMAVFDDELTPSQIRNIEGELKCRIIDRSSLILDIFAKRAQTSNAKTRLSWPNMNTFFPDSHGAGPIWRNKGEV